MKKYVSLILALCLTATLFVYALAENEISGGYTPDYKYRVLAELGILNEKEITASVSRGQFALWAMRMLGYENEAENYSGDIHFTDVPNKHMASGYISLAAEYGFVSGVGGGKFRPDDKIKLTEATAIILNATGWSEYTKHIGAYPYAYMQTAAQLKLTTDIDKSAEYLSAKDAVLLLYNSLSLHYLEPSSFGSDSYTLDSQNSDTVLKRIYSLELYEGVVTANRLSSLSGKGTADERKIEIDGVSYYTEAVATDLLAKNVVYLINEDEASKLFYMTELESDDIIRIESQDFCELKGDKLYYYENGSKKNVTLKNNIPIIKNGLFYGFFGTSSFNSSELIFDSGSVTLSDFDSDGRINAIIIENRESIIVEHISVASEIIYGKYADKKLVLSSDDYEIDYRITKDGYEIGISELSENNALTYWKAECDGDEFYNIIVSDKSVSGEAKALFSDSKGKSHVKIGDASYELSEAYYKNGKYAQNAEEIEIGLNVTAYLNANGKVVLCENGSKKELSGYLVACKSDNTFDDTLTLKIFSSNGSFVYPETASKLMINGVKSENPALELANSGNNGAVNQFIRYKLDDDGRVKEIITQGGGFLCNMKSSAGYIHPSAYTINHLYKITSKTVMFSVPEDLNDDESYKVIKYYDVTTKAFKLGDANVERNFNMSIYDCDDEYNAGAIVFENYDSVINEYAQWLASVQFKLMLVEDVTDVYDKKSGELVRTVSGIKNGEKLQCKLKKSYDATVIKSGDLLRISTDSDNYVNALYREFSYVDNTLFVGSNTQTGFREKANGNAYAPDVLYYYGKAGKTIKGKTLFVQLSEYIRRLEFTNGKTLVYIYDTADNSIKIGSFDDITEGDTIYAHTHKSQLYEVVIYR